LHATDAEISRTIGYAVFGRWIVSIPQSSFHQEFPNPLTGSTGDGRPVGNGPRPRCGPGPGDSNRGRLSAEVRTRLPGAASRSPVGRRDMDADTRSRPCAALASSPPGHTPSARVRVPAMDEGKVGRGAKPVNLMRDGSRRSPSEGMIPRASSTWERADRGRSAQAPRTQTPWPPGYDRAGALGVTSFRQLMRTPSGLHVPRKSAGL
jgi:hypothetical protein